MAALSAYTVVRATSQPYGDDQNDWVEVRVTAENDRATTAVSGTSVATFHRQQERSHPAVL